MNTYVRIRNVCAYNLFEYKCNIMIWQHHTCWWKLSYFLYSRYYVIFTEPTLPTFTPIFIYILRTIYDKITGINNFPVFVPISFCCVQTLMEIIRMYFIFLIEDWEREREKTHQHQMDPSKVNASAAALLSNHQFNWQAIKISGHDRQRIVADGLTFIEQHMGGGNERITMLSLVSHWCCGCSRFSFSSSCLNLCACLIYARYSIYSTIYNINCDNLNLFAL